MLNRIVLGVLFTFSLCSFAQVEGEIIEPYYIKSIVFKNPNTDDQFPIISLNETAILEFDDIYGDEADYYYTITHCNHDWTPSNLNKQQYLDGFDDQRIVTYENSFTTLQPYSHYTLEIPNQQTKLKITGNYILKVFNNNDEIMFSRRFLVYKNQFPVGVSLKRSRDLNYINEKQVVHFTVGNTASVPSPTEQIKVAIIQNYHWPTAITNIQPQYTLGDELIYRYDKETAFWGGNEYLNFDNKNIRAAVNGVNSIELKDIYHTYLYTNERRDEKPYTYFPDINGDFIITTANGRVDETEADYAMVHFSLLYDTTIGFNNVYVYGKFNNYAFTEENLMHVNKDTGLLEANILLKQGFYNYKYVMINDKNEIQYNIIDGNFHYTENNYLVLVYYRGYGDLYDSLVGIGFGDSTSLTN